jgi:hypothetical protein
MGGLLYDINDDFYLSAGGGSKQMLLTITLHRVYGKNIGSFSAKEVLTNGFNVGEFEILWILYAQT